MTILLAACQPMPATQAPPNTPAPTLPTQTATATATPVPPTPTLAPPTPEGEPAAAQNMRIVLERWFGEAGAAARLEDARETEWPDACFGAAYPYETCGQATMPGWELTFIVDGATYTFRTDSQAHRFRLMVAPAPDIGETIVSWTGNNGAEAGSCAMAEISATAVAFGDCAGQMVAGRFANESNRELLNLHVERFATFKAKTPAGDIVFTGKGAETAMPADQRAIAELAQLMYVEARGGQAAASWVNALALTRNAAPDRSPACVTVDLTGRVVVTDCQPGGATQQLRLNGGGLEQLYGWVDQLQPFDVTLSEKGVTTQIVLAGRGEQTASDADKQAIRTYADGLIAGAREQQPQAGTVRHALPLMLPDGLDWNPEQSEANERSFRARAEDPANPQERWVLVSGSLDEPDRPADEGTPVPLRSTEGMAYNLGEGPVVMWKEDNTHYGVSTSFSLSETLEIAGSLARMQLEEFEQVMRERAQTPQSPTATPGQ